MITVCFNPEFLELVYNQIKISQQRYKTTYSSNFKTATESDETTM